MDFYKFIEDSVRIIVDMMGSYYGPRTTEILMENVGDETQVQFDFSTLQGMNINLTVEIGQATYWSELVQVQTLDNMLSQQIIDTEMYLKFLPDGYIPNRDEIIKEIKERQALMQQQQMMMQMQGMAPTAPTQQPALQEITRAMEMPVM
jgi:hypothetical protein